MLLNRYATDASILVDIGVGRGGDLFKWSRCRVKQLVAYDVDSTSVKEAIKRYELACIDKNYKFHTCVSLDEFMDKHVSHLIGAVPVVSCQFAIHYFFKNETMVDNLFANVSRLLTTGGIFVGTFMNGDEICRLTKQLTTSFMNESFMIQPKSNVVSAFGTPIDVFLADTLYFGEQSVSHEYLIQPAVLIDKAIQFGFSVVEIASFESFYEPSFKMTTSMKTCSFSYSTFVFEKTVKENTTL
jgi:SAM-dependent methyltransferase